MNTITNRVQLIGHLQSRPKTTSLPNGSLISRFLILVEEPCGPEQHQLSGDIQLHNLVAWDQTAEIAEALLQKGQRIAIEGRLLTIKNQDPKQQAVFLTEIEVKDMVVICDRHPANSQAGH
jgi:single-strand DNA-binding protein